MDDQRPIERPEAAPPRRRPGLLRRLYVEEWQAWQRDYRKYFRIAARALGLGFVAGYLFFTLWPAEEQKALHLVVQALKDVNLEASPLVLALTLFYHNARATALALAAGLVPYLSLPVLDTILNGGVLGLLVSIAKHQHLPVPRLVLTQILPHGVFELTGILYATGVGLYLSAAMGRRARAAWLKKRGPAPAAKEPPPRDFLETYPERVAAQAAQSPARNAVRSFVLVVLPLLFIAAMIEGLITPHLK